MATSGAACLHGQLRQLAEAPALVAAIGESRGEIRTSLRRCGERSQSLHEQGRDGLGGDGDQDLAFARRHQLLEREMAFALLRPAIAGGQQPAQTAIGRPVGRVADRLEAVGGNEAAAHQQADAGFLGGGVRPHDACQRIAVRDADRGEPQLGRLLDHLMGVGGAAQEREIGRGDQLGELAHANTPCTNHRGTASPPYSPSRNSQTRRPSVSSTM